MDDLKIAGSQSSPTVHCDAAAGRIRMQGDSYPENAFELYSPVLEWTQAYLAAGTAALTMELQLVYLNTSSVRIMMDLFDLLQAAHDEGRTVAVEWHYDPRNERVADLAEEFREDLTLPFTISATSP